MDQAIAILESMLTPELVGAVVITLAATHTGKVLAERFWPAVTKSVRSWRAFCALSSVAIGALAGFAAWLGTQASWWIVPAVAFGSGPAWRLAQATVPARVSRAFLTATDCKHRRGSNVE